MPRPLELLDLPTIYRYRESVVSLDYARLLTRGSPLGAAGLMSYLNPSRHIYGAVSDENGSPLLGGVIHNYEDTFARLLYLAPDTKLDSHDLPPLIEHLVVETGKWGAFHVTAEINEGSEAYRALRIAGFAVYAWQRMWDLSRLSPPDNHTIKWKRTSSLALPAIQTLHHQIVPALLHPIEQAPKRPTGLNCSAQGETMCGFVKVFYGPFGIVLMPFIHPETNSVAEKLAALMHHIPDRHGRPVYLCVRSYQTWLEPVIEDMGAIPSELQAVMVKHLARLIKEGQPVNVTENAWAKPATPIARIHTKKQ